MMDAITVSNAARAGAPQDVAAFGGQVAAAWSQGAVGWDRLAAVWGVGIEPTLPPTPSITGTEPTPVCWWAAAPWYGRIAQAEFAAIVAAYVTRFGAYTPDLPLREPSILRNWRHALFGDSAKGSPVAA